MTPDTNSMAMWVFCAFAAVPTIKLLVDWARPASRNITPQPLTVREDRDPQTQEACQALHNKLDASLSKIEERHTARTEALRLEIKGDIESVHSRITDLVAAVNLNMRRNR